MGLAWPVVFRSLEHDAHVALPLPGNAVCDHRLERSIIATEMRWKPERDAKVVAGALRRSRFKRAFSLSAK